MVFWRLGGAVDQPTPRYESLTAYGGIRIGTVVACRAIDDDERQCVHGESVSCVSAEAGR